MAEQGLDSLLVTNLPDVFYLCGFTGSNAVLAITASRAVLHTDGRYKTQARQQAQGVRVAIAKKSALLESLALLMASGPTDVAFDGDHISVGALHAMRESLPKEKRKLLRRMKQPIVSNLRMVKDEEEMRRMEAAAALGDRLFEQVLPHIVSGTTEIAVAAQLELAARMAGAESMSFPTIVASGKRSALPHGTASTDPLPRQGFVTLDFGVILGGYCSDMTRTVHLGKATSEERDAYEAVLEAQERGVRSVAAGVTCEAVDRACRSILKQRKLEKFFTHSTGHGVGIEIHEQPRVAKEQEQALEAGMVITIEPGVYIPGKFGIRIEDTVCVMQEGSKILTKATKAWIEL